VSHSEQQRLINELRDYTAKMSRADEELFAMFLKRHRDDEDLDRDSYARLVRLYEAYVPKRKQLL
jgi:hypothetical protein